MVNIGEYVLREKDARGLTLDQLYQSTGIKPSHLSRLINSPPKTPDIETVKKLAGAFRVEPSDIWREIGGEGQIGIGDSMRLAQQIEAYLCQIRPDRRQQAERYMLAQLQQLSEMLAA